MTYETLDNLITLVVTAKLKREIVLASPEESVLFHELAHHADRIYNGELVTGQGPLQEVTAELAA